MRKKWAWILPAVIIAVALFIAYAFDTGDGEPYTVSSTGKLGASLLYDTLKHMDYNVRTSNRPFSRDMDTNCVYIVISPRVPTTFEIVDDMLEWVKDGGHLIYLDDYTNTIIDRVIGEQGRTVGDFTLYEHGRGEILTGNAGRIINESLIEDAYHGHIIQTNIARWGVETVYFAEYYHGSQSAESFLEKFPLIVRLVFAQIIILAIAAIWHLGKRFGNPVPYFEETEREENEYVRALARLYMESEKRGKRSPRDRRK